MAAKTPFESGGEYEELQLLKVDILPVTELHSYTPTYKHYLSDTTTTYPFFTQFHTNHTFTMGFWGMSPYPPWRSSWH